MSEMKNKFHDAIEMTDEHALKILQNMQFHLARGSGKYITIMSLTTAIIALKEKVENKTVSERFFWPDDAPYNESVALNYMEKLVYQYNPDWMKPIYSAVVRAYVALKEKVALKEEMIK